MVFSKTGETLFQKSIFRIIQSNFEVNKYNPEQKKAILKIWGSVKNAKLSSKNNPKVKQLTLTNFGMKQSGNNPSSDFSPRIPILPTIDQQLATRIDKTSHHFYITGDVIIGPPGTGKTYVITHSSLLFISKPQYRSGNAQRIAICTATNSAANRILTGFNNFFEMNPNISELYKAPIYIKRIYRDDLREKNPLDEKYFDYLLDEKPRTKSEEDEFISQCLKSRILIGTIYQVQKILKRVNQKKSSSKIGAQLQIFDEASQITPPMAFLPISENKNIRAFCLFGDDCQLPPISATNRLNMSIINFVMGDTSYKNNIIPTSHMILLNVQYRMHPAIRDLSFNFADKNRRSQIIIDGENVKNEKYVLTEYNPIKQGNTKVISTIDKIFRPKSIIAILDIRDLDKAEGIKRGTSRENLAEIDVISGLTKLFQATYPQSKSVSDFIKIISPYKAQISRLNEKKIDFQVGTIDSFQGQESDVVIFGMTNTAAEYTSSHFTNDNRLHVGLSRAKKKLIIILNSKMFENGENLQIKSRIFDYSYNPNKQNNITFTYNPVEKIKLSPEFYSYLVNQ